MNKSQDDFSPNDPKRVDGKLSSSTGRNWKIGLFFSIIVIWCIAFFLSSKTMSITYFPFLTIPGATFVIAGLIWAIGRRSEPIMAEIKIGNVHTGFSLPLLMILLGFIAVGFGAFLSSRVMWGMILSEESLKKSVSEEVAELVPEQYRNILSLEDKKKNRKVSEEVRLLNKAEALYDEGEYEECITLLGTIPTNNDTVLEKVLYYSIMSRYRNMEIRVRRYETIPADEANDLELRFSRFLKERQESTKFCTIHYWFGQFYLQICNKRDTALLVFDDIVTNYIYSDWLQGSLYYSAILHHEKGSEEDRKIAINRLTTLKRKDGSLRIVEVNRDFDGAALAKSLLKKWGIAQPQEQKDSTETEE
jgi:hypothetical protein